MGPFCKRLQASRPRRRDGRGRPSRRGAGRTHAPPPARKCCRWQGSAPRVCPDEACFVHRPALRTSLSLFLLFPVHGFSTTLNTHAQTALHRWQSSSCLAERRCRPVAGVSVLSMRCPIVNSAVCVWSEEESCYQCRRAGAYKWVCQPRSAVAQQPSAILPQLPGILQASCNALGRGGYNGAKAKHHDQHAVGGLPK